MPGRHEVLAPWCGAPGNVSPSRLRNRKVNTHPEDGLGPNAMTMMRILTHGHHAMINTKIFPLFLHL